VRDEKYTCKNLLKKLKEQDLEYLGVENKFELNWGFKEHACDLTYLTQRAVNLIVRLG